MRLRVTLLIHAVLNLHARNVVASFGYGSRVYPLLEVQIPEGVEDHLFRIAQELLSNTLRHSHATTLEVYLRQTDSNVLFKIEDNGVGFNTEEILPGSYGINNMKERVQGLGGQVKIVSFPNQGTTIEIKIPLSRNMEGE